MNSIEKWQNQPPTSEVSDAKEMNLGGNTASANPLPTQTTKKGALDKIISSLPTIKKILMITVVVLFLLLVFFVAFSWTEIDSFSRIVVTLGMGILLTGIGSVLLKPVPVNHIDAGTALHAVGGVLMPLGIFVTMNEFGASLTSFWTTSTIFAFVFAFYLLLSYIHKRTVIYFFAIAHGTGFIYLLTEALTQNSEKGNLYLYLNIIIGTIYLILSYVFRVSWNDKLLGTLNLFGSIGIFAFAFMLLMQSQVWEIVYVILAILAILLAVRMKSLVVLIVSTMALIAYAGYMTSLYLVLELGWPIVTVITVVIAMLLSYFSTVINKKFIRGS